MIFIPTHHQAAGQTGAADEAVIAGQPAGESPELDYSGQIALVVIGVLSAIILVAVLTMALTRPAGAQGAPSPAATQASAVERGAFAMLRGADTLVVERFIRTSTALQGALAIKGAPRIEYFATLGPGDMVQSFTLSAWAPGAAADASPAQRITMTVQGDTIVARTPAGTQRIPSRFGAVPVINNSLALTEIFTRRAKAAGGSGEFPWFAVSGGATVPVTVSPIGADSALLEVAAQPHRLAVDASRVGSVHDVEPVGHPPDQRRDQE